MNIYETQRLTHTMLDRAVECQKQIRFAKKKQKLM